MDKKRYLTAQGLLNDSYELGLRIYKSGFRPSFIIAKWRGGTPVGIAVQEILDHLGVKTDHIAIRTSSYYGINKRDKEVRIHGLEYVTRRANSKDGLLIVDDVFDSGNSIKAVIETLQKRMRRNLPENIRIATPPWDVSHGRFKSVNPGICSSYIFSRKPGDKTKLLFKMIVF